MSENQIKRNPEAGEVYAYYIECLGKYGACQVIAVEPKSICYVSLDYLEVAPPTKNILTVEILSRFTGRCSRKM